MAEIPIFLIETFENLSENLTPQTFEMSFSVEKDRNPAAKTG